MRRMVISMKRKLAVAVLLIVACLCLTGCQNGNREYKDIEDFKHAKIGVFTGSSFDAQTREQFPDADKEYLILISDLVLNLKQGRIDGFIMDKAFLAGIRWEVDGLSYIDESLAQSSYGFIFRKDNSNKELQMQLDSFIREKTEDGTIGALANKWLSDKEPENIADISTLTGENGTLRLATGAESKPFAYVKNGKPAGLDFDILYLFCKQYGYRLEVTTMTFEAILPGVITGKYDMGASGITMTGERKESVDFSEPYCTSDIVMVIRGEDKDTGFFESLKQSFEKNFIREDRWKMIVKGIGVTLLITVMAAIFGTMLGFAIYMICRYCGKIAVGIAKVYSRIIAGTPIVVILMILFYVVFGKTPISGMWVAVIGFTLTFGAFVYDHITVCVEGIDKGQTEAAYALGYTELRTFIKIVLPQAMKQFMPYYQAEVVSLVKATAVVGYIAVQDLTKMSDIIRSSTYEAFFPLISTAVIYFALTWLISTLIGMVKLKFEPKRRKKSTILKGVDAK